jgi:uncharacterized repeat protein (TIGR03806 family)
MNRWSFLPLTLRCVKILSLLAAFLILCSIPTLGQPYGLTNAVPVGGYFNGTFPPAAPNSGATFDVEVAYTNLSPFNLPIYMTAHPLTNAMVLIEKNGRIRMFPNRRDVMDAEVTTILDINSRVFNVSDSGMTGIAFHPQFGQPASTNRGFVYITYKWRPTPDGGANADYAFWRLSRFTVPDSQMTIDPNSELVLVQQFDQQEFHDAGCMMFGPDGYLYFSCGDEGGSDDQYHASQKVNERLMSGIFRIDVNMNPATSHAIRRQVFQHPAQPVSWPLSYTSNYFVPNDNPFLNPGGSVLEEYYALGLRNAYRFSRDPVTGMIWIGDIGQAAREEVNILQKGANYQWSYKEGTIAGPGSTPTNIIGTPKTPLWEYDHSNGDGCIIGGFVYHGTAFAPELTGKYIWADNVSGRVWALAVDGDTNVVSVNQIATMPSGSVYGGTSSCALDRNGEIYFVKIGGVGAGQIYKIKRVTASVPEPPALLSQLGVFTNLATLAATNTLIPYTVNSPLWSDRAVKQRWMAVPNDGAYNSATEQIVFSPTNNWQFPKGTVLVKQFFLPINETNSAMLKRLETRFIVLDSSGGVYGLTYKWRADDLDADLLLAGTNQDYIITNANGTTRTQTWIFPSRQDCLTCHNANAGYVLGLRTHQLNCAQTYPQTGVTDNQLRTLGHLGVLGTNYSEAVLPGYPQSCSVTNTGFALETRVRSYIDANCSQCHRPGGAYANFDARFTTPLDNQGLIYGAVNSFLNDTNDRVVVPGDLTHSLLYNRANRVDAYEMPPLAKNIVDTNAVTTIAAWISSLSAGPGVTLSTPSTSVEGSFSVTVTFTVPITGLTTNQFTVSNGTITSLSGSGANYTMTISPAVPGQVVIRLPAGRVHDGSGHLNYASNPLSVTLLPGPMLLHRWSFNGDANDSAGGANATLVGTASVANNQLHLPGGGPFANYASVNIGSTLSTNPSLTVETWLTINTLTTWSKTWIFGYDDPAGQPGLSLINFTPRTGGGPPKIDFDTSITGEMNTLGGSDPASLVTGHEYHVVATYDALNNLMSLYIDGVLADSASMAGYNITQLGFNTGRFGCGYFYGDPDFNGSINEMRIYSGALSPSDIANNFDAGSEVVIPPGTIIPKLPVITSFSGSATNYFGSAAQTFTVSASGSAPLTYQWLHQGTNMPDRTSTTLIIGNPSVSDVGAYQVVVSNTAGAVTSSTANLTLLLTSLKHRWSFSDLADPIGGANVTLVGSAALANGSLQLPGGGTFANYGSVDLSGTLANNSSISVECWVTLSALQNWSKVWMFGQDAGGQPALSYINFTPRTGLGGNPPKLDFDPSNDVEFNTTGGANFAALTTGHQYHAVAVYDSGYNLMTLYLDGEAVDSGSMGGHNIAQLGFNTGRFGCGYFYADPDLTGAIDEMRVYAGVLTANDVANNFQAGPNVLTELSSTPGINISISRAGLQPILSWPVGVLEQANEITGPWTTVSGVQSPYAPPTASAKRFYRARLN